RASFAPGIAAIAESTGLASYDLDNWFGLFAPASTPPAVQARLHAAVVNALKDPALAQRLHGARHVGGAQADALQALGHVVPLQARIGLDELPQEAFAGAAHELALGQDAEALRVGQQVLVKHGTAVVRALVQEVAGRLDLDTLRLDPAETLGLNDIGQVRLHLAAPLPVEPYAVHRRTGAFLVIDPHDGATLAAGMVRGGDE
ncbi:tripartite tricarboxylate transporter substrate-binding protein, partial [Bacillus cereus]|nr:tripartite tricarboxylate transporter substrate-binding protein [Bacillus cereus]